MIKIFDVTHGERHKNVCLRGPIVQHNQNKQ